MKNQTPQIITEGDSQYQLGNLKGDTIHYDFDKILEYLNAKGKLLFGDSFKIYQDDISIIYKLCLYTIQDEVNCKKYDIDINKGLLLTGPVGCGKTSLMKLIRHIIPHKRQYQIIPCRNAVFSFNHIGYKTIEDYGNDGFYCFDDLGVEPTGRHYGKDCNVMGEILLSRYELFSKPVSLRALPSNKPKSFYEGSKRSLSRSLTHVTTNLNAEELESRYGNRVRSRMRQMFNLIAFDKESKDKRL